MKQVNQLLCIGLTLAISGGTVTSYAQNNPYADGNAAAPDEWLLVKKGNPWWYETKPSQALPLFGF